MGQNSLRGFNVNELIAGGQVPRVPQLPRGLGAPDVGLLAPPGPGASELHAAEWARQQQTLLLQQQRQQDIGALQVQYVCRGVFTKCSCSSHVGRRGPSADHDEDLVWRAAPVHGICSACRSAL